MSMCISDRQRQIDCLRQVLRLQPDHSLAQSRLAKLTSSTGPVTTWSVTPEQARAPAAPAPPFTVVPPPPPPVTLRPSGETFPAPGMAETAAAPAPAGGTARSPRATGRRRKPAERPGPEGEPGHARCEEGREHAHPALFVLLLLGFFLQPRQRWSPSYSMPASRRNSNKRSPGPPPSPLSLCPRRGRSP